MISFDERFPKTPISGNKCEGSPDRFLARLGIDTMTKQQRSRGSLLGMAVGDCLGAAIEFKKPGTFEPLTDIIGGGPFKLKVGEWTDDTSLALCIAESLIEKKSFDPVDQMERYIRWWHHGHLSSTGECFDMGNATKAALLKFLKTRIPYCGSTDPLTAGNGSIMRLAPIPIYFQDSADDVLEYSALSSKTTHAAQACLDSCIYLGFLIRGALQGKDKDTLLSTWYEYETLDVLPLCKEVQTIRDGSYRREPPEINGKGYVINTLEAALWAFNKTKNFKDGCLLAVNLGEDSDTVGAVYGQLAGAYYGEDGIPEEWRAKLAFRSLIEDFADKLVAK